MMTPKAFITRRAVPVYYFLTFSISWVGFIWVLALVIAVTTVDSNSFSKREQ